MIEYKTTKRTPKLQLQTPQTPTITDLVEPVDIIPTTPLTATTTTSNTIISVPPTLKIVTIMSSTFSQAVMISLNEHMAQTLLDSMTSTIRSSKLDMNSQIQGLELLVENLEALNARVESYMTELKERQEDTFCYDELDLEGLEEWADGMGETSSCGGVKRIASPVGCRGSKARLASRRLTTLCEEDLSHRPSFETISSKSSHSASGSITIKVDTPSTPPLSSHEQTLFTPSTPGQFRQIDPKKIPKRKPVPATQLQIPQKNNKAFKRKEVPTRMYEHLGSSSTTVNTVATLDSICGGGDVVGFDKLEAMWTPPVTDEECSPIRDRGETVCIGTATAVNVGGATAIYQPKPRRVKSKQLKISIPRKGSGGKGSGGSIPKERVSLMKEKSVKMLKTPSSAPSGSVLFQKRTKEEMEKIRFSYEECDGGRVVRRMDSGREKRKSLYGSGSGSMKRKLSLKTKRRRKYENGIPRCDSPVLGSCEVVFARR
ncbi:hypothetical protein TWF225_011205 [Orbilia oligospora]|nr:hypothetical protein TWF225_011205 [Orbilia oligospora]KAF3248209.1 hypothetical protein TWF217_009181 [Orbilia oligospora]KAF3250411.1 hypothetical protein TWF128_007557 [Orbilia oligospora]KAF3285061.1 hypothetical protein TWF132_009607 [Orbilia oligospora]